MTTARRRRRNSKEQTESSGDTDYRSELWRMADALRGNMDAAEYKHVVLGLVFLKYISDAFEEAHARLANDRYADPEDQDEYLADNIFWVPPGGALAEAAVTGAPAHNRSGRGRCNDRHRAGQPGP